MVISRLPSLINQNTKRKTMLFYFQTWLLRKTWPSRGLQNLHWFPRWNSLLHQISSFDGFSCSLSHWGALVYQNTCQVWTLFKSNTCEKENKKCSVNDVPFAFDRYRLTAIAVDHAAGPYQNYTVIFVGSEAGVVLKILAKTRPFSLNDSVLLEEIEAYNHAK